MISYHTFTCGIYKVNELLEGWSKEGWKLHSITPTDDRPTDNEGKRMLMILEHHNAGDDEDAPTPPDPHPDSVRLDRIKAILDVGCGRFNRTSLKPEGIYDLNEDEQRWIYHYANRTD